MGLPPTGRGGQNKAIPYQIRERAVELLADGEWHDYEAILLEVAKLVPPGMALRYGERVRRNGGGTPERSQAWNLDRIIRNGKRGYANASMRDKAQRFEITPQGLAGRGPQPTRRIRLTGEDRDV